MEATSAAAPAVVAVVVTHNPGEWFDETLASLAAQDYPGITVVVVDTASDLDITPRVAEILPSAYVKRLTSNPGFAAAANEALTLVEGASFLALCHDDIALDPDAIRLLLEESFRSNASLVGPKIVDWDDPGELRSVGMAIDKAGVTAPFVEPGERDQEQHDSVRDVFYLSGACIVIRADLFAALGGFDPMIDYLGEDLDLCWRAHVAGARVMVVPSARVRHRHALTARRSDLSTRSLIARHRLRSVLSNYSFVHLVRVLPQAFAFSLAEALYNVGRGKVAYARAVMSAWTWNLGRTGSIRDRRATLKELRTVDDSEVRTLQVRGSARLAAFFRSVRNSNDPNSVGQTSKRLATNVRTGLRRTPVVAWAVILGVVLFGSRNLLQGSIPAVNEFANYPKSAGVLVREFLTGWRTTGFGSSAAPPTAELLLGVWGWICLGALGFARMVVLFGCIPLGLLGFWRLTQPLPSRRARAIGLALYAANPLPYNALANGSWAGLAAYALMPWIIGRLGYSSWHSPFAPEDAAPVRLRFGLRMSVSLGLFVALGAAVSPMFILIVPFVAACLVVGSIFAGGWRGALRGLGVSLGASVVAFLLHLPWSLTFLQRRAGWDLFAGVPHRDAGRSFLAVLRFNTGPMGAGILGFALLAAGILPLLIGRGWRLAWAARLWCVAAGSFGLAVAVEQGWVHRSLGSVEMLLAPAAVALAYLGALGLAAFELDLPRYRFGWHQAAVFLTAIAGCAAFIPPIISAANGRWHAPESSHAQSLSFLPDAQTASSNGLGGYRVLWLGDPQSIGAGGWRLAPGLQYSMTPDRLPDLRDRWTTPAPPANDLVPATLDVAIKRHTLYLGRLLAPLGVRYVAVVQRPAPALDKSASLEVPASLTSTLAEQLDLQSIQVDDTVVLYENLAWVPARAEIDATSSTAKVSAGGLVKFGERWIDAPLAGTAVLTSSDSGEGRSFNGRVVGSSILHVASTPDSGWHLTVDGKEQAPVTTFGWSQGFAVTSAGQAHLSYSTPGRRYLWVALEVLLWVLAIMYAFRRGRDTLKPVPAPVPAAVPAGDVE